MGNKRLYKVEKGKKICGVCLGIADYLNIDVTLVRLVWAAATIFTGFVAGIILYIGCAIIMPEDDGSGTINGDYKEL